MKMRLTAALPILLASTAYGDVRPRWHADGSVSVGTQVFSSTAQYLMSDAFRERGGRCGSEPPADALTPTDMNLIAPTDCAMNKTVINPDYNDDRALVVQVVFHIIKRSDGVGDISPALLQSQIDVL